MLYGDTDSLFVHSGSKDFDRTLGQGRELATLLNRDIARHIEERWRVPSRLELEFEKLVRQALPALGAAQHARGEQALRRPAAEGRA